MQIIREIEKIIQSSNNSREIIGKFVLDNQRELSKYTVEQIAKKTFTSKATVVRFAHFLGFSSWREFMSSFTEEVHHLELVANDVDANYPFKADDSTDDIVTQMKDLHIQSVNDTVSLLEPESLEQAIKLLKKSVRIEVFAANPNNYLAKGFQRKMLSIGKHIDIVSNGEMGLMAGSLGSNDCAIIISYSGSIHSSAVEHARLLQLANVPIIAITSNSDSYLSNCADIVLNISSRERMYTKIENFASEISIIYILNLLFSMYFRTDYDVYKKYRMNSSSILESNRNNEYLDK